MLCERTFAAYGGRINFFNHRFDQVAAETVAQVAVVADVQDQQIGLFAGFQRANPLRAGPA